MEESWHILFKTPEGKKIFSVVMTKNEIVAREFMREIPGGKKDTEDPQKGAKKEQGERSQGNDDPMTPAQKRYLFRILAEQGIEGDNAHEHLKKLFQVETLKDITKFEASRMIERLLSEAREGGEADDTTPF